VVERHAVGDATTPIMACHRELVVSQSVHHLDQVVAEPSFRMGGVILCHGGPEGGAVPGQIRGDDGVLAGQRVSDRVPHDVALRIPVQEQHRWPAAADAGEDVPPVDIHVPLFESLEHHAPFPLRRLDDIVTVCTVVSSG
jgi:hypothetical protein